MSSNSEFLLKLQAEAKAQKRLFSTRFFPPALDIVTSFIGRYSWQVILISSGVTSLVVEFWLGGIK